MKVSEAHNLEYTLFFFHGIQFILFPSLAYGSAIVRFLKKSWTEHIIKNTFPHPA